MSDAEDAAAVLEGFVPIRADDPRAQEFRDAVIEDLTLRPAHPETPVSLEEYLARIDSKLDDVISLLRGGPP